MQMRYVMIYCFSTKESLSNPDPCLYLEKNMNHPKLKLLLWRIMNRYTMHYYHYKRSLMYRRLGKRIIYPFIAETNQENKFFKQHWNKTGPSQLFILSRHHWKICL